jgi:hypothetical protein
VPGVTTPVRTHRRRRRLPDHHGADDDHSGVSRVDSHAWPAHDEDGRQLGLRLQPQRAQPGAHDADGKRPDEQRRRRVGRPATGALRDRPRGRSGRPSAGWARHRLASSSTTSGRPMRA